MKKFLLPCLFLSVFAGNAQVHEVIRITGTRFTFPVFRKWISEYNKIHPEIKIVLAAGLPADSADIIIASHILQPGDVKQDQSSIALARYVQLPVVNSRREDLNLLKTKGFSDLAFKDIYFSDTGTLKESAIPFNVYRRQKAACSSVSFANHFGNEHKDIKGAGVPGDDLDLLQAVKADKNAISHNSLGLIYNLKTRKVNDSIAVVPIDLDENGKIDEGEKIYTTLDEVIAFVEKTGHPKIPVENINIIFSKTNNHKAVTEFLQWVLTNGLKFNHDYGIVNLNKKSILEQEGLLAQRNFSCTPSFARLKKGTGLAKSQQ